VGGSGLQFFIVAIVSYRFDLRVKKRIGRTYDRKRVTKDNDGPILFEDCRFEQPWIGEKGWKRPSATFENITLVMCRTFFPHINQVILRNCSIEGGLMVREIALVFGALFDQVKVSGKIGSVNVFPLVDLLESNHRHQGAYDEYSRQFYESVEWALDISEASFSALQIHGVPPAKVIINGHDQVLVSREKCESENAWQIEEYPASDYWRDVIEMRLEENNDEFILVAPRKKTKAKTLPYVEGLQYLVDVGVARRSS